MRRGRLQKRVMAFVLLLTVLLAFALPATSDVNAESLGDTKAPASSIYFYNAGNWGSVGAYIYGDKGELLGGWGNTTAAAASELGDKWLKVEVGELPPFSIIFYNKDNDSERAELYLPSADHIYVSPDAASFTSKEALLEHMEGVKTKVYFFNYSEAAEPFEEVYAYAYINDSSVAGVGWPGLKLTKSDIGDNWWETYIPANALTDPINVIFSDNGQRQLDPVVVTNNDNNYATLSGDGLVYTSRDAAEISSGINIETTVYLFNNNDWENMGVYVYGNPGEALGGWPGKSPVAAPELGDRWYKITVPATVPFNIIFFNLDAQDERTELLLSSEQSLYVTGSGAVYGSAFEAEAACGMVDESELAVVYFYNSRGWGDINAYTYKITGDDKATLGASWPGTPASRAAEIGENWWKVTVPVRSSDISADNKFGIIFNDGVNQMPNGAVISDPAFVYTIPTEEVFDSPEAAMAAAALDDYDDGCEEGPNSDLDDTVIVYDGYGARAPYISYEAEEAETSGVILPKSSAYSSDIQSEASGRSAVRLDDSGEYVEFTLKEEANAIVLRYSIPDSMDGAGLQDTLSLYINGSEIKDMELTSAYSWVYGSYPYFNRPADGRPHRFYDEIHFLLDDTYPAGSKVRLQKDAGDNAEYYIIDLMETEKVAAPGIQPEGSISVTDHGAIPGDGIDDRAAFEAAIEEAMLSKKEVWIPAGDFDLKEKKPLNIAGITIRGAGYWYSNLKGQGAGFKYSGTVKFRNFAILGDSRIRDDAGDLAAIEGNGSAARNVTIDGIWVEHTKVGVWSCNTENLLIQNCRIRNTYADGINLCSGTSGAVVRNNHLRNTGDDAIASWPWLANCYDNRIVHNTVAVPTLANAIAIYGGGDFVIEDNYLADTIANGAGIAVGSEFQTAKGFTAPVTVRNNKLDRCGSMQIDEGYPVGAIWIWSSTRMSGSNMNEAVFVNDNLILDSVGTAITIECGNDLTNVSFDNNTVDGAVTAVHEYYPGGAGTGFGTMKGLKVSNVTGELWKDDAPLFTLSWDDADPAEGDDNGQIEPGNDSDEDHKNNPSKDKPKKDSGNGNGTAGGSSGNSSSNEGSSNVGNQESSNSSVNSNTTGGNVNENTDVSTSQKSDVPAVSVNDTDTVATDKTATSGSSSKKAVRVKTDEEDENVDDLLASVDPDVEDGPDDITDSEESAETVDDLEMTGDDDLEAAKEYDEEIVDISDEETPQSDLIISDSNTVGIIAAVSAIILSIAAGVAGYLFKLRRRSA
ncbi:starch-binding protein [Butyrivibrio sp. MC2013]|uniref:starch-binding protein n=1 Tax=Butyrivibrio sp. MC2013 TaxID=1280686 RepID=UPI00040BAD07|nr:starch-binding protein [Butyrivibrio sp. MC2013]